MSTYYLAVMALIIATNHAFAQAKDGWRTDLSRHTVPLDEIVAGGPPKDGIPAIDRPRFETPREAAKWLGPREPVIVVEYAGEARAYPYRILIWHEIVNDRIGDLPIAVTFCPLCNIALVFDRRLEGRTLNFGTTGKVRHSDLVMYDRQTESWWQQATGEGIVGAFAGSELKSVASQTISWAEFRTSFPNGRVLSQRTGFDRPYGRNPYVGYDGIGGSPIAGLFRGRRDDRLPAMDRVAAVAVDKQYVAYPFSRLSREGVVNDEIGKTALVVFWQPGTSSALDHAQIEDGRDIGATGVFDRRLEGRVLRFERTRGSMFRDRETGSHWNLLGRALSGPLKGKQLRRIAHGDYFWFAWAAFRPETRIWR